MMLCNTAANFLPDLPPDPLQDERRGVRRDIRLPISVEGTKRAQEARAMPIIHSRDGIMQAASWIHAVMEAWRSKLRDYHVPGYHVPGEADAMTGA
jgi:hypothetical protein